MHPGTGQASRAYRADPVRLAAVLTRPARRCYLVGLAWTASSRTSSEPSAAVQPLSVDAGGPSRTTTRQTSTFDGTACWVAPVLATAAEAAPLAVVAPDVGPPVVVDCVTVVPRCRGS